MLFAVVVIDARRHVHQLVMRCVSPAAVALLDRGQRGLLRGRVRGGNEGGKGGPPGGGSGGWGVGQACHGGAGEPGEGEGERGGGGARKKEAFCREKTST